MEQPMKLKEILKSIYDCGLENSMDMLEPTIIREIENITKIPYMKKVLYKYLQECYTDGYYGDSDLSENYVTELEQTINCNLGKLNNLFNINALINKIPSVVYGCIANTSNVFLAGGSVTGIISGQTWENSDWDLFCHPLNEGKLIYHVEKYKPQKNIRDGYSCWDFSVENIKIQIIVSEFSSIEDVLNRFDITVCQFAISKLMPCLYGTDLAFQDLQNNLIRINPNIRNIKDKEILKARIEKYYKRGFSKSSELESTVQSIPVTINDMNLKSKKSLKLQAAINPFAFNNHLDPHAAPNGQPNYNDPVPEGIEDIGQEEMYDDGHEMLVDEPE